MNSRIGHYEILGKLGEGGMGIVYKARDIRLDRIVALKILQNERVDQGMRNWLVREARAASCLNHPNIVTIYDIDTVDGVQLIAMEYVQGRSLADIGQGNRLSLTEVLQCALQIAEAAGKAHDAGVVHRDLKPGNIMLTREGQVKILDFGLAKKGTVPEIDSYGATVVAPMTTPGLIIGTVAYMSPEQALGEPVDGRSDVFSLGVILYELISGVRPFTGSTTLAILQKIHIETPNPLKSIQPDLPESIDRVIAKALAKVPSRRYQHMREMQADLAAVLQEISQPASASVRLRRELAGRLVGGGVLRKYPALIVVAAAVLMFAAVFGLLRSWTSAEEEKAEPVQFAAPSGDASPADSTDWSVRATTWLRRYDKPENIDRAIQAATQALERDAGNAMAYAILAESYFRRNAGTPDPQWMRLAAESARKAVELNNDLAAAHLANGIVLLNTPNPEAASNAFQKAISLDPLSPMAYMWLGEYYSQRNDMAQAEEYYNQAIRRASNNWMPHFYFGTFLYRHARYPEAVARFEMAGKLSPDNASVLRNLAGGYHMLDRYEEAATVLQRALEINPTAGVFANLGTARFFQGRYSDSVAAFEKAVERNPTVYLYWGNLGDAHRWIPGNEAQARQAYGRAIALLREKLVETPDDAELRSSLAVYFVKSGDRPGAISETERLRRLSKRTAGSYFKELIVYELAGDRAKALEALEAAIKTNYPLKEIQNEPELTTLRGDRRYHEIIGAVRDR